jgi:hypothetical protein
MKWGTRAAVLAIAASLTPSVAGASEHEAIDYWAEWKNWYGWQTFASDVAGASLIAVGEATRAPALDVVGIAGWWVGAPVLHAIHGNPGRAIASGVLRALPAFVAMKVATDMNVFTGIAPEYDAFRTKVFLYIGAVGGCVAVLDALAFAFDDRPPEPQKRNALRFAVEPTTKGARATVGAAF